MHGTTAALTVIDHEEAIAAATLLAGPVGPPGAVPAEAPGLRGRGRRKTGGAEAGLAHAVGGPGAVTIVPLEGEAGLRAGAEVAGGRGAQQDRDPALLDGGDLQPGRELTEDLMAAPQQDGLLLRGLRGWQQAFRYKRHAPLHYLREQGQLRQAPLQQLRAALLVDTAAEQK